MVNVETPNQWNCEERISKKSVMYLWIGKIWQVFSAYDIIKFNFRAEKLIFLQ